MKNRFRLRAIPILLILASVLEAQSVVTTGTMRLPRRLPTTTVLSDGRVLATGGGGPDATRFAGEVFDPATGTWSTTGPMELPRLGHTSIVLNDGRVLVAGGGAIQAELFDPITRTFSFTGFTSSPQVYPAVKLRDGRIFILGDNQKSEAVADIFNPLTNAWTRLPAMEAGIPIGLPDGRLVVVGSSSALLYRVTPDSLQLLARHDLKGVVAGNAALMGDGRILLAGGRAYWGPASNESAVYDPRRGTVSPTGRINALLVDGLVPLRNGAVFSRGGANDFYEASTAPPSVYEPTTGIFTLLPFLPAERAVANLQDGRVLLVGADSSWLFTPAARVVSAASQSARVAPGSLATLFGAQMEPGTSVTVTDRLGAARPATILYTSVTQINLAIPEDAVAGPLRLTIQRPGAPDLQANVDAATVAPDLFQFEDGTAAAYAQRSEPNGTLTVLDVRQPISLDQGPVYLVLYGTGIRNRTAVGNMTCAIGGISVSVDYAGPGGSGAPGLDQVNVRIPEALRGRGIVDLSLKVDGVDSNSVTIEVK